MEFSEYLQWDRVAPFLRHPVVRGKSSGSSSSGGGGGGGFSSSSSSTLWTNK